MSAVLRSSHFAIGAALIAVVASGCARDDGTQASQSTGPRPEISSVMSSPSVVPERPIEGDVDVRAYCGVADDLAGERPESYVGSSEHQADVRALAAVAPEQIRDAVDTYRGFLASGAVDPADPDSNLTENWPTDVRAAIEQIVEFNATTC